MTLAAVLAEADRVRNVFAGRNAVVVQTDVLQPAETLLDVYGEDIRGRSYLTSDPVRGEMVLRPDFTVPVVQMHMQSHAEPARYTYAGKVFRKQDSDPDRLNEFVQVGYEVFDGVNPALADAEVFAAIRDALGDLPLRAATGDIGILTAAVAGLRTSQARKDALTRHIWRPRRFRALLDRFGGRSPVPSTRAALLKADDPFADAGADIGKRSRSEVESRIAALRADAALPPVSGEEMALLDTLMGLRETSDHVLSRLRDIAVDMPAISPAVMRLNARLDALENYGVDVGSLEFEGSYGRT